MGRRIKGKKKIPRFKTEKPFLNNVISNLSTKDENFLGRGEFSEVWEFDGSVIKRNSESSLFNPHLFSGEKGLKRSKRALQSEFETFQLLQNSKIMPKFMIQHEDENGRFYLIRESGKIPIKKGQEKLFLPEWEKNSVTKKEYNAFVEEIYRIAQKQGYFQDLLQPAIRKDGSLFLTDLGLFITVDKAVDDFKVVKSDTRVKNTKWRINNYREVEIQLEKLDDQIGIQHTYPNFVIKENIAFYQKEYDDRVNFSKKLADLTTGKILRRWKSIANEIEFDKAFSGVD